MRPCLVTVTCDNPACPAFRQHKSVGLVHLGQDVYLAGTALCGACDSSNAMRLVDPPVLATALDPAP